MKLKSTNKIWNAFGDLLLPVVIALVFLVFTFAYFPFREKLQFDTDEGLNLMRSMLVAGGHSLYSEISSDQPPLFTQILALLFRVTGFEVNPAPALVLMFSTLLVWSGAQFLQLTWGKLAALLFLPLMIMVPRYLVLSTAVMIGVPSIALASVSMLFLILWHQKKSSLWLILSGSMLALSVLIKLFTGFFAPIFFDRHYRFSIFRRKGKWLFMEAAATRTDMDRFLCGPGIIARAGIGGTSKHLAHHLSTSNGTFDRESARCELHH